MTPSDNRSAQRSVDERAMTPETGEAFETKDTDKARHERRGRTAGPTRAAMVSALRAGAQRPLAEPETSAVAETSHEPSWSRQDTLAASLIAVAPAGVALLGGFGAPILLISVAASALILAVAALVWRAAFMERPRPAMAGPDTQVSAGRFPQAP
jgi:hypothetical protein